MAVKCPDCDVEVHHTGERVSWCPSCTMRFEVSNSTRAILRKLNYCCGARAYKER